MHEIPSNLSEIKKSELEEIISIAESAKGRGVRYKILDKAQGIFTIEYCGIELAEVPILGKRKGHEWEPLLYLGGEVREDEIHMEYAEFPKVKHDRLIRLIRSADSSLAESRVHFLHPHLAHPKSGDWFLWSIDQSSKGSIEKEFEIRQPYYDLVLEGCQDYIKDDMSVVFLACGFGFEIGLFYNLIKDKYSNVKITGIDLNEKVLSVAKRRLPKEITLIKGDLRNLPRYFKKLAKIF